MSYDNVPKVVRIKRKRHADPLQALFFEEHAINNRLKVSHKRQKGNEKGRPEEEGDIASLYFTLAKTEQTEAANRAGEVEWTLSEEHREHESAEKVEQEKRKFYLPKPAKAEDVKVADELTDMVHSYLHVSNPDVKERKSRTKRKRRDTLSEEGDGSQSSSDYVYDVYHLQDIEPLTSENYPKSSIGFIKFLDDEDETNGLVDERSGDEEDVYSADEDSNAEDFYQNDYPSDEDAGAYSETYFENSEEELIMLSEAQEDEPTTGEIKPDTYDNLFEELYEANGSDGFDLLEEDVYSEAEEKTDFDRNEFFPSDKNDDLAIYRDRIFHKLKKMVED